MHSFEVEIGMIIYIQRKGRFTAFSLQSLSNMHVLPLEIQHNIFLLACTDGGRTGQALSLTSRSYRDAVRPVRLHSVAIRTVPHIENVLQSYMRDQEELEASGSTLKPRVRHLLLSPADKGPDNDQGPEDKDAMEAALIALLQLVGPTLRTLAYTAPICFVGLGGICPMPKLEELTIFLDSRERQPNSHLDPARPPASYPALRKLHIVLSWGDIVVPDLLGWWSKAAPNVTDLRLTNVGRSDRGKDWVECMIGVCSPKKNSSPDHQDSNGIDCGHVHTNR